MADASDANRPLSPHLSIYRPQLNSITSILTRITGNALIVAAVLLVWWFTAAAVSAEAFATADAVITSWFGDLVMLGSVWALWFHSLSGLRHLYWDTGRGYEVETSLKMGWGIVIGSVVLTVLTVVLV